MLLSRVSGRSGVPGPARGRGLRNALAGAVVLGAVFVLGPRARVSTEWVEPSPAPDLDAWLAEREASVPGLKPGEAESILWADPVGRGRTRVALVYLHGFSADRHEIEPLVSDLARDLRANAYFARLSGHAQDGAAMGAASVEDWLADAAEAVAVGERIGERIVLVGTSTGGTLALWAAAQPEAAGRVHALVLVSPNLGLRDGRSGIMLWPWGETIARAVVGPERCFVPVDAAQEMHWTVCYPTRALVQMMALVDHVRSLEFEAIRAPTLVVYSPDDAVVDPEATRRELATLGGSGPAWYMVEESGDPADHVIAGDIMSPGTTDMIRERIGLFLVDAVAR